MTARRPRPHFDDPLVSVEICAGAGGQASGLHQAGFDHAALVEWDGHAVETLKANVGTWPGWTQEKVDALRPSDVREFLGSAEHQQLKEMEKLHGRKIDLLAGGVPCPPFSLAGKQLGKDDERDLFPDMLRIVEDLQPRAILIENVRGILEPPEVFIDYRRSIINDLKSLGYSVPEISAAMTPQQQDRKMRSVWRRMDANAFGVPQLRPRAILVAFHKDVANSGAFVWPVRDALPAETLMETLQSSMRKRYTPYWDVEYTADGVTRTGAQAYDDWERNALTAQSRGLLVAPTLVGGSRKHGGADLGPTRAKKAWAALGVDAKGVANDEDQTVPERDLFRKDGPMLTVDQAAAVQGFRDWTFAGGGKTARYRQVGNAFPPPVAEAVGRAVAAVLRPEHRDSLLSGYQMADDPDAGSSLLAKEGTLFAPAARVSRPRAAEMAVPADVPA
ncbi:DNA cytosine methyltransferase [Streptomyces sp. NRRL F-2664]|uniref:DNA cytosine methyltransferase n=1 Tax=Streptomyces sp. NRRL F-2664 TaxID=1463842 RepID=UPI0007C7F303|nr:DNA (cytosine-5-)-methyltransferase [Streptomyces sp. NRRL F-2664]